MGSCSLGINNSCSPAQMISPGLVAPEPSILHGLERGTAHTLHEPLGLTEACADSIQKPSALASDAPQLSPTSALQEAHSGGEFPNPTSALAMRSESRPRRLHGLVESFGLGGPQFAFFPSGTSVSRTYPTWFLSVLFLPVLQVKTPFLPTEVSLS